MPTAHLVIFLVLIFLTVFLVMGLILIISFGSAQKDEQRIRARLAMIADDVKPDDNASLIRQRFLQRLSPFEQALATLPGMAELDRLIEQTGRFFPSYQLLLVCFCMGIIAALAIGMYSNLPFAMVPIFVIFFWIPIAFLKFLRKQRQAKFEEQLPDALEIIVRAMRVGYRFNDALHLVIKDLPDPISAEFSIMFDELNYGVDVRLAFQNLLRRMPSVSLMAIITAVLVHKESGGNLTEILHSISSVIRNRFRFQRKVKTLTTESRLSMRILALVPIIIFIVMKLINPDYMAILFTDPNGQVIIGVGLGLMVLGSIWVRKILQIDA